MLTPARVRPLAALLVLASMIAARPAAGQVSTTRMAGQLEPDAPVLLRFDFDHWERLVDEYARSGLPGAQGSYLVSAAATALLGFDPLVSHGWLTAGFDINQPMIGAAGLIDGKAATADRPARAPAIFWRGRLLLAVDDRGKVDATFARFAKLPGFTRVTASNAGSLARTLGASNGPAAVRQLRSVGAITVGKVPIADSLVILRRVGDLAIIDLLTPFGGRALDWNRDAGTMLGHLRARGGSRGPWPLSGPGLSVRVDAVGGYDAYQLIERDLALRAGHSPLERPKICAGFRDIVSAGPFDSVAMSVRAEASSVRQHRTRLRAGLSWGLRGPYKLASAFLIADDKLIDPGYLAGHGASLAGAVYLKSFAPIRALSRPRVFQLSRRELRWAWIHCGPSALATGALFGWPQLFAMFLDQLAGIHPQAAALVEKSRNAAFAIKRSPQGAPALDGFLEGSFDPAVAGYLESYLDALFGKRTQHRKSAGAHITWGAGPIRPYRKDRNGMAVFGAGHRPRAVRWRMGRPPPGNRSIHKLLAEAHVHLPSLLPQLIPLEPSLASLRPLMNKAHLISAYTRFDQGTLESFIATDLR